MRKGWRNLFIIVFMSLLLQACASTRLHYQFQEGMQNAKRSFDSGNFKEAFCRLLPLAVAGCAEAQYALGYLYYYGYGVSEDTISGLFWIEESAKRGYPPAIKALSVLKANPSPPPKAISQSTPPKPPATKPVKYTLQVFGSYDEATVKELQTRLQLEDSTFRGITKHKGRDWYVLTYGKYPAMFQAVLAKDELPRGIKELKPWVRKTDDLQWLA